MFTMQCTEIQSHSMNMNDIQTWATVNPIARIPGDCIEDSSSDESHVNDLVQDLDPNASKHRLAILATATAIAIERKRQATKRKSSIEPLRLSKKPRHKVAHKIEQKLRSTGGIAKDRSYSSIDAQNQQHEPLKRYLQPTKQSRLNKISSGGVKMTSAVFNNSDFTELATENKHNNTCQPLVGSEVDGSTKVDDNVLLYQFKPPVASFPSYDTEAEYTLMDLDFDDAFFSTSDEDPREPATPIHNPPSRQPARVVRPPSLPVPHPQPQPSTKLTPFLRLNHEYPIPAIRYSPIPRLNAGFRIQTCFRIAEALRVLKSQPQHGSTQPGSTIELFAIVTNASTTNGIQTFKFADLFFSNRPPYIEGRGRGLGSLLGFSTKGSSSSQLSESVNIICRAMIRSSPTTKPAFASRLSPATASSNLLGSMLVPLAVHQVEVQAIRLSDWDEIKYVRGIVDPEGVELEASKYQG